MKNNELDSQGQRGHQAGSRERWLDFEDHSEN